MWNRKMAINCYKAKIVTSSMQINLISGIGMFMIHNFAVFNVHWTIKNHNSSPTVSL